MDKKILKIGGIVFGSSIGVTILASIIMSASHPLNPFWGLSMILQSLAGLGNLVGIIMVIIGLIKSPPTAKVVAQKADIYEDEKEKKSSDKKTIKSSRKKEKIYCKSCGKQIPASSKFCEHCGEKV